ncbi:DUF2911 domain-containing protein [Sphingobacterium sp. lm-10]|uniref:DUF2911 domain-containing protein n=1 Tax=Sphingobacterium sp. lm-10 TaxID=2944904 RepID=UPI002020ECF6|nr:DUF2911 domain-containing protein [Sphingobacterium sp. lm-10]MCL7989460.1 DUF2911 domain-containing protein [Sphingobacterium sp. lm-10]
MKKLLSLFVAMAAIFSGASLALAQAKLPPASSTQQVSQGLGISKISLTYQRPNANGRTIFGGLVPYGEVWRTGANNATAITFDSEVMIHGKAVPAGTYGLFTIPTKGDWTIILNKTSEQWGAYTYKQEDDILRFTVKPNRLAKKVETFSINFENVTTKSLDVVLSWENVSVPFTVSVDQTKEIMASLETAMKGEKKPYFQAAQYYFQNNLDMKKSAEWIEEADKGNTKAAHVKYWKAKILTKAGDKAGAAKAAQEGIDMAKQANNVEYIKLNTEALKAAK